MVRVNLCYTVRLCVKQDKANKEKKMFSDHVPTCHPSTKELEAEGLGVQGHRWLQSKLRNSLSYMKPCSKQSDGGQSRVITRLVLSCPAS